MWRKIVLAATVGLASVAIPVPAKAAESSPLPALIGAEQNCEQVLRQAQRAALASGKGATVPCMSRVSSPMVAPDASTMAGCGLNSWSYGRHSACMNEVGYTLNVIRIQENGVPVLVGQIISTVTTDNVTSGVSSQWTHRFTLTVTYQWGAVGGASIHASAECGANCSMVGWSFNSGPIALGPQRSGTAQSQTTSYGEGTIWRAWSTWRFWYSNPAWFPSVSNSLPVSPPAHRCDEAVGIRGSIGCVYDNVRPVHEIGSTRYPKYARHIQLAINHGLPSVLTRTQISAQVDANRARACPQSPANGWSCDEYPYASTHEGAANPIHPYGRTFQIINWNTGAPPFLCGIGWLSERQRGESLGYSVCGIPLAENTGGGTDLGVFYVQYRVLHNDQFQVRVV